ncbi:hypothetical protein QBC35DRAFT_85662 [Podospora australis]|uniref:Uncharacterized protein n=1 Tax=Podospora australis TaxID=1536484 RepID=A0AAN7AFB2_9PEZI|nr:hypothetical protein QBC35DRAFT_85662 [Podospora australis]
MIGGSPILAFFFFFFSFFFLFRSLPLPSTQKPRRTSPKSSSIRLWSVTRKSSAHRNQSMKNTHKEYTASQVGTRDVEVSRPLPKRSTLPKPKTCTLWRCRLVPLSPVPDVGSLDSTWSLLAGRELAKPHIINALDTHVTRSVATYPSFAYPEVRVQ